MEEQLETKQEVTKKFTIGIVLIITSLVIGKISLIPIILFPGNSSWRSAMIILYICGWMLLIPGIGLAGVEGYRLVKHKYRHYKNKTVHHVKNGTRKAAQHTVKIAKKTGQATKIVTKNKKKQEESEKDKAQKQ